MWSKCWEGHGLDLSLRMNPVFETPLYRILLCHSKAIISPFGLKWLARKRILSTASMDSDGYPFHFHYVIVEVMGIHIQEQTTKRAEP